jgi:hypothetical protein
MAVWHDRTTSREPPKCLHRRRKPVRQTPAVLGIYRHGRLPTDYPGNREGSSTVGKDGTAKAPQVSSARPPAAGGCSTRAPPASAWSRSSPATTTAARRSRHWPATTPSRRNSPRAVDPRTTTMTPSGPREPPVDATPIVDHCVTESERLVSDPEPIRVDGEERHDSPRSSAGHSGLAYASPPQARDAALVLVSLPLGASEPAIAYRRQGAARIVLGGGSMPRALRRSPTRPVTAGLCAGRVDRTPDLNGCALSTGNDEPLEQRAEQADQNGVDVEHGQRREHRASGREEVDARDHPGVRDLVGAPSCVPARVPPSAWCACPCPAGRGLTPTERPYEHMFTCGSVVVTYTPTPARTMTNVKKSLARADSR